MLVEYFKELEEESIRDNFVIIYELLDEMMDFGFPQTTESKILQEYVVFSRLSYEETERVALVSRYITQESYKLEVQVRPPIAVTNAVSWRSEGIRYRKNEVFLDVIESVNLLVSTHHRLCCILCGQVNGSVGQRERKCCKIRDFGSCQDEMLPLWHARAEAGPQRQSHVRKHRT